MNGDVV